MTATHVVLRVLVGLLGGYAFAWGFMALGMALGVAAGMPYEEARQLFALLVFLVLLVAVLWAFVELKLARVAAVLMGGGALMTAAGFWLGRVLG